MSDKRTSDQPCPDPSMHTYATERSRIMLNLGRCPDPDLHQRPSDQRGDSPCRCSRDSWGAIQCEERSGPPGTYCVWEHENEDKICCPHGVKINDPCPDCIRESSLFKEQRPSDPVAYMAAQRDAEVAAQRASNPSVASRLACAEELLRQTYEEWLDPDAWIDGPYRAQYKELLDRIQRFLHAEDVERAADVAGSRDE